MFTKPVSLPESLSRGPPKCECDFSLLHAAAAVVVRVLSFYSTTLSLAPRSPNRRASLHRCGALTSLLRARTGLGLCLSHRLTVMGSADAQYQSTLTGATFFKRLDLSWNLIIFLYSPANSIKQYLSCITLMCLNGILRKLPIHSNLSETLSEVSWYFNNNFAS